MFEETTIPKHQPRTATDEISEEAAAKLAEIGFSDVRVRFWQDFNYVDAWRLTVIASRDGNQYGLTARLDGTLFDLVRTFERVIGILRSSSERFQNNGLDTQLCNI